MGEEEGGQDAVGGNAITAPKAMDLLNFIGDKDARLGLVTAIVMLFVFTVLWVLQVDASQVGADELSRLDKFWNISKLLGIVALCVALFVVFFKAVDGTVIPKILVWFFTGIVILTLSAFWLQAILRTPTPFLIEARCFVRFKEMGCPFGIAEPAPDDVKPAEPLVQQAGNVVLVQPPRLSLSVGTPELEIPIFEDPVPKQDPKPFVPPEYNKVEVQFVGAVDLKDVANVSTTLEAEGWNVQNAARGGERTVKAIGVDQVRYFFEEDKVLADALAVRFNELAKWEGFDQLSVARLRGFEARVAPGYLEVWTSVD